MTKEYIQHIANNYDASSNSYISPPDIMDEARLKVKAKGSTTVTMAYLDSYNALQTCNLGDSGYILLRPEGADFKLKTVHRSES